SVAALFVVGVTATLITMAPKGQPPPQNAAPAAAVAGAPQPGANALAITDGSTRVVQQQIEPRVAMLSAPEAKSPTLRKRINAHEELRQHVLHDLPAVSPDGKPATAAAPGQAPSMLRESLAQRPTTSFHRSNERAQMPSSNRGGAALAPFSAIDAPP